MGKYLPTVYVIAVLVVFSCAPKEETLEEAPIITSATYQHTQYNGLAQPAEAKTAQNDAPLPVLTYFRSEADLEQGLNGESAAPAGVGTYYVRIERPAGNGYRQGKPVKIEYQIQKAFISIVAEPVQRFGYDGSPKEPTARVEPPEYPPLEFSYFDASSGAALSGPPSAKGSYRVHISFPGNDRYMGASSETELVIQ
jgi:hypothetical protein